MIGDITKFFFDKPAVMAMVDDRTRDALSYLGFYIRNRAIWKLKRRAKASKPGQPPTVWTEDTYATLRNIGAAYNPVTKGVLVGVLKINQRIRDATGAIYLVPQVMEHGGTVSFREEQLRTGEWVKISRGRKVKDRFVPVWLATADERRAATGKRLVKLPNGHVVTYLIIPGAAKVRIRSVAIAPRPFVEPAMRESMPRWQEAFARAKAAKGAGRMAA
jgi:hypothetical protein